MSNRSASQKKLIEKKNIFFRGQSSFSNRVYDSVLFSGFRGMEIDNMAMMIRTFNKWIDLIYFPIKLNKEHL